MMNRESLALFYFLQNQAESVLVSSSCYILFCSKYSHTSFLRIITMEITAHSRCFEGNASKKIRSQFALVVILIQEPLLFLLIAIIYALHHLSNYTTVSLEILSSPGGVYVVFIFIVLFDYSFSEEEQ